jgi:hypothetical protein
LAVILSIPTEAARLIVEPSVEISEERLRGRLRELVPFAKVQRQWVWEIHKNCDQLLHQRLASFTAAQAMTLAAFTLLTVARFNADPKNISMERIWLLEGSRVLVILFGAFLAFAGFLVTYPMFKRLRYLNETFLFPLDQIYSDYFHCIEWTESKWSPASKTIFPFPLYRKIIPLWLPVSELVLWGFLMVFLLRGVLVTYWEIPIRV